MGERITVLVAMALACMWGALTGYLIGRDAGREEGIARATCYAAHLPYVETTSAGVVCGEPAVLLPILTEPA